MKLDKFLDNTVFKKYNKKINEIRDEFINEGCEKFLWTSFQEQEEAMEYTQELLKKKGELHENKKITTFLEQFKDIDWATEIAFIYPENYSSNFFVAQELAKNAKSCYIINNIFDEDDTVNWIAIFDKDKKETIQLMFHVIYSSYMSDNYGGYKLFGKGLMYYADALEYGGRMLQASWPLEFAHFQGNNTRRDTDPFILLESRKVTKMLVRQGYFTDELEIFRTFQEILLPVFQKWYIDSKNAIDSESKAWKDKFVDIKSELVGNGTIHSKWKSEQTLFQLVRKEYEDAIFQYRPTWLEPQSLDIYIPSLSIGIEYQGVQHFRPVDFFGGEEGFAHRQILDKNKKKKCADNNVKLVEWYYKEDITKSKLKEKLIV